ncbi:MULTISPECIES: urease accessory UreF family protein [unclassified Actinopolyspora]|uniref:urease accessory protein UreF n=1 Tax=unclassified Actinopolyspora TaxID=2639451 RepID=UPI0013F60021|nr:MULTISPECIES: urease accessory UreF family protein [unclassified Actinopolyspora]NHD18709.1 urease accessory protein UreF [Actinopolyspora sp. BKK2]NHE77969.1 urease accessory protein UreF [Actinopolyspora sp. BKK1]
MEQDSTVPEPDAAAATSGASLSVLALADARLPGGGHAHSGGLEEAVHRGVVADAGQLREFLHGRLHGAGGQAAAFAAAAARAAERGAGAEYWRRWDVEFDARTPSPAQRNSSRAQGRGTARAGRAAWPCAELEELLSVTTSPHHPAVVGALLGARSLGTPKDAAAVVAYLAVSGPSAAAVRLLGLDPFAANAAVAALERDTELIARRAASTADSRPEDLPSTGAPALDLLAQAHQRHHEEEVRLFAS